MINNYFLIGLVFLLSACDYSRVEKKENRSEIVHPTVSSVEAVSKGSNETGLLGVSSRNSSISDELYKSHKPRNPIEAARNSTVFIDAGFGSGSGFFYKENCIIVTNKHVIKLDSEGIRDIQLSHSRIKKYLDRGVVDRKNRHRLIERISYLNKAIKAFNPDGSAKKIKVILLDEREFDAKVLGYSEKFDLAYLNINEKGCEPLKYKVNVDLPIGERVYTIGNPAGMKYSVTSGIISGEQEREGVAYIQTDAAINPGNSGGALIDSHGFVVGVNTMILSNTEGIGFAIPITTVNKDYKTLEERVGSQLRGNNFWSKKAKIKRENNQEKNIMVESALRNCLKDFDAEEWGGAIDECEYAAINGNSQAQYIHARLLLYKGGRHNRREAIEHIRESSGAGYAEAIYYLGVLYHKGDLVGKNISLANDLYKESCEKKFFKGCNSLGIQYLNRFDFDEAKFYFEKAIQYGSVIANFNLAYMFEFGKGVEKDNKRAYGLYKKAALLGSNLASYKMFWLIYSEKNRKGRFSSAYSWLLLSEMNKNDVGEVASGWDKGISSNVRHTFEKIISSKQRKEGEEIAERAAKDISVRAEEHRVRYLYQRENNMG